MWVSLPAAEVVDALLTVSVNGAYEFNVNVN